MCASFTKETPANSWFVHIEKRDSAEILVTPCKEFWLYKHPGCFNMIGAYGCLSSFPFMQADHIKAHREKLPSKLLVVSP